MESTHRIDIRRLRDGGIETSPDVVAVEEPLEIRVGFVDADERREVALAITMRTPGSDVDLAFGFLFTEGIISGLDDVESVAHCEPPRAGEDRENVITAQLADGVVFDAQRLQRHFYTTSSCGVCGKASLDALRTQSLFDPSAMDLCIAASVLIALPEELEKHQRVFEATGGLHGAALFNSAGMLESVREDVGRHNALDKLVGASLRRGGLPWESSGLLLSGRGGFELLQKAAMAGCPVVAAVGAPSSLAVDVAEQFGITLVGFLKHGGFNIYTHPERIQA
ncbi:MAG: formate dehydrogenase accessory sulfurtransferase FdhD, partial [Pseudomonadales bacterium]